MLTIVFTACKKDETIEAEPPETTSVLDYMPLTIGNYWIYETFNCDSGEVNCTSKSIDTSMVTKDTIINGNTYYKIEGNYHLFGNPVFIRDSGDYLVNHTGRVLFTHIDTTQVFNHTIIPGSNGDTIFYYYDKLMPQTYDITLEDGTYSCLDMRTSFFRKHDNFQIEHNGHSYYCKDVGIIKQLAFWASNLDVEKRELIGYHLE